ncbi:unnamed protein product [Lota lota]
MISLLATATCLIPRHKPRNTADHFGQASDAYPLTDTDSLRHSRVSGAPLLSRPTRKRPRQATPPSRHREQQRGEEDERRGDYDDQHHRTDDGARAVTERAEETCPDLLRPALSKQRTGGSGM